MTPDDAPEDRAWASGIVCRVRRTADLSQRELADHLDVAQSTVARWETGRCSPSIARVEEMAALAGLRLVVVDDQGQAVEPMRDDAARDRAGRHYPAHLDPYAFEWWTPPHAELGPCLQRHTERAQAAGDARVRFRRRGAFRDLWRRWRGTAADHPTHDDLVLEVDHHQIEGEMRRRQRSGRD